MTITAEPAAAVHSPLGIVAAEKLQHEATWMSETSVVCFYFIFIYFKVFKESLSGFPKDRVVNLLRIYVR